MPSSLDHIDDYDLGELSMEEVKPENRRRTRPAHDAKETYPLR